MTLDLSRWQFAITTIFHFIFVPLTIGLALLLAIMQTTAYRNRRYPEKYEKWSKMTLVWRRLFPINFAIGVVTGIVQEFQFGHATASRLLHDVLASTSGKNILYFAHRLAETAFDAVIELQDGRSRSTSDAPRCLQKILALPE